MAAGVTMTALRANRGMVILQKMFKDFVATGLLGQVCDVYLADASAYEAKEFERITNRFAATITFPAVVLDRAEGRNRAPRDGAFVIVAVPGTDPSIRLYDANTATWQVLSALTLASSCPMSDRYQDKLTDMLAVNLSSEIGFPIDKVLARSATLAKLSFASKYDQPRRAVRGDYF